MPLRFDVKRHLLARSDRVKAVDIHPTEPWILAALYSGIVQIWDYASETLVKTFEAADVPIRAGRFIARKNWFVCGSDDFHLRVYNYNTHDKVTQFEAHPDYIRTIVIHGTQPFCLTGSDDMTIKLWNWEQEWKCLQVFEGHTHYVMSLAINPKDPNTFASACLDRTVKVWSFGSPVANFTLEAHDKGVNYVDYCHGGDRPYLVTTGDDKLVKIWDYQTKSCVQVLSGHMNNVSFACYHPGLPLIVSGSEDGTVKLWNSATYRLEQTLDYGLERAWCITYLRGSNLVGIGFDEGTIVVKLGREEPTVSMDVTGKIIWARHNEIEYGTVRSSGDDAIQDGERVPVSTKDLGSCEIYPQSVQHSPNGRFVVACGDGEYIIYTALRLNNKAYGNALDFVWAANSNEYAIRESNSLIRIYKAFKERPNVINFDFPYEGIYGGYHLGIKSKEFVVFVDWHSGEIVRRIDVVPKNIFWSDNGSLVAIICEGSVFILRHDLEAYLAAVQAGTNHPVDGVEASFSILSEIAEDVKTGKWVGECFVYTSSANRLNYVIGNQVYTITHFDSQMYLLGYISSQARVYLVDKDLNVVTYGLSLSVMEYQTAVLHGDMDQAQEILKSIPEKQKAKVARFLEAQGHKQLALEVTPDMDHKFDLAISLNQLERAYECATAKPDDLKWKTVGDVALKNWDFVLAEKAYEQANDVGSLFLIYTCTGNAEALRVLVETASQSGEKNLALVSRLQLGDLRGCIDLLVESGRVPEAALFAHTYAPGDADDLLAMWKGL